MDLLIRELLEHAGAGAIGTVALEASHALVGAGEDLHSTMDRDWCRGRRCGGHLRIADETHHRAGRHGRRIGIRCKGLDWAVLVPGPAHRRATHRRDRLDGLPLVARDCAHRIGLRSDAARRRQSHQNSVPHWYPLRAAVGTLSQGAACQPTVEAKPLPVVATSSSAPAGAFWQHEADGGRREGPAVGW